MARKEEQYELHAVMELVGKYFPADYTPAQQMELIEKLLKNWAKQNMTMAK